MYIFIPNLPAQSISKECTWGAPQPRRGGISCLALLHPSICNLTGRWRKDENCTHLHMSELSFPVVRVPLRTMILLSNSYQEAHDKQTHRTHSKRSWQIFDEFHFVPSPGACVWGGIVLLYVTAAAAASHINDMIRYTRSVANDDKRWLPGQRKQLMEMLGNAIVSIILSAQGALVCCGRVLCYRLTMRDGWVQAGVYWCTVNVCLGGIGWLVHVRRSENGNSSMRIAFLSWASERILSNHR